METLKNAVDVLRSHGITTLYHFTDRANVQSIIDNGGLFSWKACARDGITIERPGGDELSRALDSRFGLGNYVRLSFTKQHPMMYVAKNDGRVEDPVILEIDLSVAGLSTTLFSDRNATKTNATIATGYNGVMNIHFNTVCKANQFDCDEYERSFYQAEVLVLERIPLSCITNINMFMPKHEITRTAIKSSAPSAPYSLSGRGDSLFDYSQTINNKQGRKCSFKDTLLDILDRIGTGISVVFVFICKCLFIMGIIEAILLFLLPILGGIFGL